jgi:cysteine-rich repeat protein
MLGVRSAPSAPPRPRFGSLLGSLGLLSAACALPHAPLPRDGGRDSARPDAAPPDATSQDVVVPPTPDVVVILPGSDASCAPPTISCGDRCVDPTTDPANCGGCGVRCSAGARCDRGACACPPGEAVCNNVCVNFATDPANCGGCMIPCRAGLVCSGGVCTSSCAPPRQMCGMSCTDTSVDNNNCGRCGVSCPVGSTCTGGACVCSPGTTLCGSACVNLVNDPRNCGSCGQSCTAPTGGSVNCVNRSCVPACPADQTLCSGACQPRTNPNACGPACTRCIAPINGTVSCNGTQCVPACNMGFRLDGILCVTDMPPPPPPPPPPPGSCGNRMLDMNEECEDGNTTAGDGCSATCTVEPGVFTDTCSGGSLTIPLSRGQSIWLRGTTVAATNDYTACINSLGPDRVVRYRVSSAGTVTVSLNPVGSWDIILRGGDECPGVYCNNLRGAGYGEGATFMTPNGQTWFHTIDGAGTAAGPFILRLELN